MGYWIVGRCEGVRWPSVALGLADSGGAMEGSRIRIKIKMKLVC